jgi:hypothetical protein
MHFNTIVAHYVQISLLFHSFFTFLIYYIQISISTRGVLKLLVTQFFNIFEALKKKHAYYYVKKRCESNLSWAREIQPTSYYSWFFAKVDIFVALYASSHFTVTSHSLEGFWRKPIVAFPQILIQIQSKYCCTFWILATAIVKTIHKSYITVLKYGQI